MILVVHQVCCFKRFNSESQALDLIIPVCVGNNDTNIIPKFCKDSSTVQATIVTARLAARPVNLKTPRVAPEKLDPDHQY
jgi:hypothetical protein